MCRLHSLPLRGIFSIASSTDSESWFSFFKEVSVANRCRHLALPLFLQEGVDIELWSMSQPRVGDANSLRLYHIMKNCNKANARRMLMNFRRRILQTHRTIGSASPWFSMSSSHRIKPVRSLVKIRRVFGNLTEPPVLGSLYQSRIFSASCDIFFGRPW